MEDEVEASIAATNDACDTELFGQAYLTTPRRSPNPWGRIAHQINTAVIVRDFTVSGREATRLMWSFCHPFAADLLACAETNS